MHNVNVQIGPRQFSGVTFGKRPDAIAVHNQIITVHADSSRELAVGSIVLGQVRIGRSIGEIVNRNDLYFVVTPGLVNSPQNISANAAKTIYCNFYWHDLTPWKIQIIRWPPVNPGRPA
jgi:hypothetical protein